MGKKVPIDQDYFRRRSTQVGACLIWDGKPKANGYGSIKRAKKFLMPHRLAYEVFHGPIPSGLVVCHSCDNPMCVNPDHLRVDTQKANIGDRVARGRSADQRGHLSNGARFSPDEIVAIRASQETNAAIARRLKIDQGAISRIRSGKSYQNVPIADVKETG